MPIAVPTGIEQCESSSISFCGAYKAKPNMFSTEREISTSSVSLDYIRRDKKEKWERASGTLRHDAGSTLQAVSRRSLMDRWKFARNKGSKEKILDHNEDYDKECTDYNVMDNESPPADDNMVLLKDSMDDVSDEALRVKIVKDQLRADLLELMRSNGGNVRALEEIENGSMTTEALEQTYGGSTTSRLERNVAFLWSAFMRRRDLVEVLLKCGADINYCEPVEGFSALHLSAFSGCVNCLKFLISKGAKVNYALRNYTPLHSAAFGNSVATAQLLINNGARTDIIGSSGDGVCGTAIHSAIKANSVECVQLLAKYCSDINCIEPTGAAPIHEAADLGYSQCLQVILDVEGVDVNVKTKDKKNTALHLAAESGNSDCISMLLLRGVQPDVKNSRGQTALHFAAKMHFVECVETLLKTGGCDPNVSDNDKRTPLHCAVGRAASALEIVEILVSWRADVNKKDKFGYTPLHIAALNELSQCVESLIYHGADVTARTVGNMTALGIIVRKTPASLAMFYNNLDKAISMNDQENSSREVELKLDFRCILQHCPNKGEISFLNAFIEEGQKEILAHPLCEAFLHVKWEKIRKFYIGRLIFYMVFVVLFSSYVMTALANDWYRLGIKKGNFSICNCTIQESAMYSKENCIERAHSLSDGWRLPSMCVFFIDHPEFIMGQWIILMMFTFFEMFRKIYGLFGYTTWGQYFSQFNYEDVFELLVIISVLSISCFFPNESRWQNHIAAAAVLAVWYNIMTMVGQLPSLGTYVAMYTKVIDEFAKLLFIFIFLLIGFTISFCIIHPANNEFQNPWISFINVLIMMSGELEKVKDEEFSLTYLVIYILFIFVVTFVLMNLLVGIAVNDIQGLKKTAGLSKLIRQTQLINTIERAMFNDFIPKAIIKFLTLHALVSPSGYRVVLHVKPLNPGETRLPNDILKSAYELAKRKQKGRPFMTRMSSTAACNSKYHGAFYQPKTGLMGRCGRPEAEMEESAMQFEHLKEEIHELKVILLSFVKSTHNKDSE